MSDAMSSTTNNSGHLTFNGESNPVSILATSLLASLTEIITTVTTVKTVEHNNFLEFGTFLYRVTPAITELKSIEYYPANALEILQSLHNSIQIAKETLRMFQQEKTPANELSAVLKKLEGVIKLVGEDLSSIPPSTFQEQEYAAIALRSLSEEMKRAHFEPSELSPRQEFKPQGHKLIMSGNESSSKKARVVYDSGCDRLSELPSSIVDIILSSISTRDAVRMSILSKQFRYAWISLPHLVFDKSDFSSMECMEKFVTNVLKLHKGPIFKFEISALLELRCPIVDEWLLVLPENEIRELILKMDPWMNCPDCSVAYSFNKLTRLELHSCDLDNPPLTFTGFLFLRCLILVNVDMTLNAVESIVASSPLLETLKLNISSSYEEYPELRISAPNLKHFDFESYALYFIQIYLCAPILAEMRLSVFVCSDDRENCSTFNYTKFFDGCTRLQKLNGNFTKIMSYGIDSCQYSFVLPYLKVIELDDVNFGVAKQMSIVARLVSGAPNLQELKLTREFGRGVIFGSDSRSEEDASYSDSDFLSATGFKCEKLKIITIRSLTGLPSEIQFLKLLLEISPALERMNVYTNGPFQKDKNLRTELLKCNLASPKLKLSVW